MSDRAHIVLLEFARGLEILGTPPPAPFGVPYSFSWQGSGGLEPYTWTLDDGLLPATFAWNAATATIDSAAPTTADTVSLPLTVTDAARNTVQHTFELRVLALPLQISGALPAGTVGVAWTTDLTVSGGVQPYVSAQVLVGPAWMTASLAGATITLSGTPAADWDAPVEIKLTDSADVSAIFTANLTIEAAPSDPYWSNVIALLHFDGTDGARTFVDEKGNSWGSPSDAELDTAEKKFGSASLFVDGTGYIDATNANFALGRGDFTVEMFVRLDSTIQAYIFDTVSGNGLVLQIRDNQFAYFDRSTGIGSPLYFGPDATPYIGVWVHIAVARGESGVVRAFLDGVMWGEDDSTWDFDWTTFRIGGYGSSSGSYRLRGHVDDVRITKGVARYNANFTPPTEPFLNQ